MIEKTFKDKGINILFICIDSMDLYNLDNIHKSIIKEFHKTKEILELCQKYYIKDQSKYSIQKRLYSLNIIHNLILENHLQEKIRIILNDWASFYPTNIENFSLTTTKYLNRFVYKYKVFYRYDLKQKINIIKSQKSILYNIAIINLYVLNNILSKNGPYMLHKYLYSDKGNLDLSSD